MIPGPPRSTFFPYTTLFRSLDVQERSWCPAHLEGQARGNVAIAAQCEVVAARRHQRPERLRRSEEHTSELQSPCNLVCRLLLEKKKNQQHNNIITEKDTDSS